VLTTREYSNPGHNPVTIAFAPTRGRFVKVEATELWKAFESYPAFFALSEVEILSGDKNLAINKVVRSSDGMMNLIAPGGRSWSGAALSDGFGPDGLLVSTREWMMLLDQRLRLETRRYELQAEAENLINTWRRRRLTGLAILGLVGAFLIVALPIRYRIHANRELKKVRERIAGDLHDEVGSNLGSIQMFADLAEGRSGPSDELKRIQRIAAETVSAVRDIVWLLQPQGDHRIGTVEHLRETASIMLEALKWKFSANEEAWLVELPDDATRHLFLYFREALHNISRHAKAAKVEIRVETTSEQFQLIISDDGVGIAPERLERPATLRALRQRSAALNAELHVDSSPEKGTRLTLTVPLDKKRMRKAPRPEASAEIA
jgi:signal transduction histidine kinase